MKKYSIFLSSVVALFLFAGVTQAQVFMVVKGDVSTPYTDLEAAVAAAEEGSTVYIPTGEHIILKSQTIAGSVRSTTLLINKRLSLVGAGSEAGALNATQLRGDVTLTTEASGSRFEGLTITGYFRLDKISDFLFKRCKAGTIYLSGQGDGNIFRESMISSINGMTTLYSGAIGHNTTASIFTEILVQNCIITGNIYYVKKAILTNNVFTLNGSSIIQQSNQCVITNNIFLYTGAQNIDYGCTWNSYTYNMTRGTFATPSASSYNTVGDNIENAGAANDLFAEQVTYRLKDGAPGKNAGADGTDMGIYGGAGAKDKRIPSYPQITEFVVGGTSHADGTLPVSITVEAQEK